MLSKMKIPLPPTLEDQMAITNDLKQKMDEVERVRQAVLHQKEAIAVMQGAILREVFPYKEGDKIPVGWRWKPLGEVCLINPPKKRGFSRNPNTSTSFVPMEAVDELKGTIGKRIIRPFSEVGKGYTFFEDGDVLFAKITPCMQNGKSAIADNLIDGIGFGSTEFHVLRAKIDITKEWIYHFVRSVEFRKRAQEHFEGSAGQQRVPTEFIEKSLIPLPPSLDEQIKITNELHRKMAEVEKMRQAIDREYGAVQALPGAILQEVFDFEQE
jgi:type I restriction enzyme S subunit